MKSVGVKFVEANTVEGIIFFVPDTEQLKHKSLEGSACQADWPKNCEVS